MANCADHSFNCARASWDVCYESGGQEFFLASLTTYDRTSISQKFMKNKYDQMTSQFFHAGLSEVQKQVEFCGLLNYGQSFENVPYTSQGDNSSTKASISYYNTYLSFEQTLQISIVECRADCFVDYDDPGYNI